MHRQNLHLWLIACILLIFSCQPKTIELDLFIKGATILDGTGSPAQQADIGIEDGKISFVGNSLFWEGDTNLNTVKKCQCHWRGRRRGLLTKVATKLKPCSLSTHKQNKRLVLF